MQGDRQAAPHDHCLSWSDASQWVLDRPLGLWPLLLEHSLLERAKELVAQNFTSVVDAVASLLGAALKVRDPVWGGSEPPQHAATWPGLVRLAC